MYGFRISSFGFRVVHGSASGVVAALVLRFAFRRFRDEVEVFKVWENAADCFCGGNGSAPRNNKVRRSSFGPR